MGLIKKILKIAVASKMADDYGVFPAAMYLANSKPDDDAESYNLISLQINDLIEDAIYFNRLSEITYQLKKIVDDNLDKFSKEEQQELYKKINYAIDAGTKAKSKKKMLNLIKGLKKHRITLTNEEEVIAAINNGFE